MFGYERWENFEKEIYRSMESCEASGIAVLDYFREVTKMITIGKGRKRKVISLYKPESRRADMNILASMSVKKNGNKS